MKALKKLTAIVLAVCMLIGMPLSIDVSAVKSSNPVTSLEMIQAMPYIADPRYSAVATDSVEAQSMFVVFNSITGNNGKWSTDILVVDRNGAIIRDSNNKEVVLLGSIQGGTMPSGWNKPLRWQLKTNQSFANMTINNFYDVKAMLDTEYFTSRGAKMQLRVWESAVVAGDGLVDAAYCEHDSTIKLKGTHELLIGTTKRDGVVKDVTWKPVNFTQALALNDKTIALHFSEPISQNADKGNIFIAVRIVDTTNNYALKYNGTSPQQFGLSGGWYYSGSILVAPLSKGISEIQAICDGFNAAENTDKYKVMFCLEEKGDKLSAAHGESIGNGYVDSMWGRNSGMPLSATTMPKQNIYDGAYCEITMPEELESASLTIKGVYPVSREDLADKLVIEFSEPVNEIKGGVWIRAFGADDALLTHDPATKKLTNTDSGHLQWGIGGLTKASVDGTRWIGTLSNGFDCDTYAEIVEYLNTVTDAQGKAITPANGYKIQLAILDNSTEKIHASGLIEGVKSADGTKMLYAANRQNLGEERAVCNITASLNITGVDVYADTYVVVTFSEDIDMAQALSQTTSSVWISATHSINDSSDPVQHPSHVQHLLVNARQFGNAKNKIVYDLPEGASWAALKAKTEDYIATTGNPADLGIHIQGGPSDGIVSGFVSEDGERVLYRSAPTTAPTWGGRYKTFVEPIPYITVTNVKADTDKNALIVSFSEPVKVLGNGWNSIRVTVDNNLVGPDNAAYQLGGALAAVNPDAEGYSAVWTFKASTPIAKFAHDRFFNDNYSKNPAISLCMSFQANGGSVDGLTDHVVGKNGGMLKASPYHRGAEGTYLNITNDPMLVTDQIIQKVELVGQNDALLTLTPIQSYGGTKSWRIIDGATGVTKVINGTEAVWNVTTWSNYLNGNKQMVASGMAKVLGVNTFDGIRGLMDADDKLVFAFSDNRVNGVIDDFYMTSADGYKLQKAHYSTATEDVAYFVVDTNVTKEALSVTEVSVYERSTQTYAHQDRFLIFTFSHEISDEMLANIRSDQVSFWMTVKEVGGYNWWKDNGDGNGYVYNNNSPYHSKVAPTNFNRYGNTGNKLIAAVAGGAYVDLINRVNDINAKKGGNVAELAVRMETSKLTGQAGVNNLLKPADANVLPVVLDQAWGNGGRTYTPAFNEGRVIQVGSIELIGKDKAEVKFVDESGNPVTVTNSLYNPGAPGLYVAIRLTKDGKLAWSNKGQIAAEGVGTPLQFSSSLKTKNGTTADSTWVLSCNGLADLIQAMDDVNGYYRKNGLDLAFALEGGNVSGTSDMQDYLDAFTTTDGKGVLRVIKGDTAQDWRYFYSYLNHPNAWITSGYVPETVKVVKTEAITNTTLQVTFDQAINVTGNQNYFRIVDGVNNLIRFDTTTKEPLGNIMTVGENGGVGLAQVMANSAKADTEGKVWNFTISGGLVGNYGFANITKFVEGLPASGNNWVGDLHFALILEEAGTGVMKNNGLTDHIVAADGGGAKLVNNQMGHYIGDGSCLDITADMVDDFIFANPLTVTSAKQINKNQLLVTFSEAVEIADPWMGIRYVDENNELIYSNRDASGVTIKDPGTKGAPMQWSRTKWEWSDDTHTAIVVTFKQDIATILDGSNLPASLSPATNPDYKYRFVIEETNPEKSGEAAKSGLVCDVYAVANANNMLVNSYNFKKNAWDGHCVEVTNVLTPDTLITVSDATITGENQVTFEWSHSVDLTKPGSYYAAFRYVNADTHLLYGNDKDGWMQFGAYLNYVGEGMIKMTAHVTPSTKWGVYDIDDLLNPTGALKEYMDANPGKWIVRIEEMNGGTGNGVIDTFFGKDGQGILADPMIGSWADGVDMDIVGTPITGELSVVDMAIISDTDVKVTFSAPIQFAQTTNKDGKKVDSVPFVSMRLYNSNNQLLFWNPLTEEYTVTEDMFDKDGKAIYRNQNGYTTEKEGPNAEGEWVPYARQKNTPMQWSSSWKWGDDKHTSVIYTLSGGAQLPVKNITDILSYDFTQFIEGSYVGFDIEENTPAMIPSSGHVDNILRADNAKIALDANFFPHNRDSVMRRLEDMTLAYKPGKLVSKTEVISDTQIRVSFSQPVILEKERAPFMAIRMIDKEGNLMWSGKENLSQPYQWSGTWEWEDETHQAFIWTMTQTNLGASTIYDLANWKGVLQKYKEEGTWMFVIEELDKGDYKVGRHNGLVDNVTTKDGTIHLLSTYSKGYDGILTSLNVDKLVGPEVKLLSAQALDDQTIKLTFSEAVSIADDVSMGVRYLSESGDSEVLTDGKVAYFKGEWKYADDNKNVIIWTLKSKSADNLTDIINFNGTFEWNKGARVAFVIMDAEDNRGTPNSMRIKGIYDINSGFRTLTANYATKDYPMTQLDIEVLYDIPAPEASGQQLEQVVYVTNYVPFIIASAVIVVAGLAVAIILFKKRKKNEQ